MAQGNGKIKVDIDTKEAVDKLTTMTAIVEVANQRIADLEQRVERLLENVARVETHPRVKRGR